MQKFLDRCKYLLAAILFAFTATMSSTSLVFADPPANNGTLKIHELGTLSGTEDNDPKVCTFNVEGFGFDTAQSGYLQFDVQGGDGPTGVNAGPYAFGPTNDSGYYGSQYFYLQPGHYKATLYGKDLPSGAINLQDEKAKSKVFKVTCQPITPATVTFADSCGTTNDTYTIPTTLGVDYQVAGVTKAAGTYAGSGSVTVTAVAQANYTLIGTETWSYDFTDEVCTQAVTPATVTFADSCGTTNDTYTIPTTLGVDYQVAGVTKAAGTYAGSGSVTVTAVAQANYTLSGTTSWTHEYTNALCVVAVCTVSKGSTEVNVDSQFMDSNDNRSAGHYSFTANGLHIYTDDSSNNAKVAWYHNVAPYSLADAGEPSMNYTTNSGIKPGLQMVVDFDGNGTTDGILIGESSFYGNDWWLNNSASQFVKDGAPSHTGGFGSANHGTLSQWLTSFPNAKVTAVGFSLGSGVKADGVLHSLTFGCYTWTFKEVQKTPETPAKVLVDEKCGTANDSYTVPSNGNGVTYSSSKNGNVLTVVATPDATHTLVAGNGFVLNENGTATFTYTFTNEKCPVQIPVKPAVNDPCGLLNATWIVPQDTDQLDWKLTAGILSVQTKNGLKFTDNTSYKVFGFAHDSNIPCESTPKAPIFADACGVRGDKYTIPFTTGVYYKVNGSLKLAGTYGAFGTIKVTAHALPGFDLDGQTSWSHTFTNAPCDQPATPEEVGFVEPDCENASGYVIIPSTAGVIYKIDGKVAATGSHKFDAGTSLTVSVEAASGYVLDGQFAPVDHTFDTVEDCVLGDTDVCPNIDDSQATVPQGMTVDDQGDCVTPEGGEGEVLAESTVLADTGESTVLPTILAALLPLLAGIGYFATRRKSEV